VRRAQRRESRRVALVGNSFGGAIATHFATRHPDRVSRLVCMGANVLTFPVGRDLDAAWGYTPSRDNMARILNAFPYNKALITDALVDLRYQASLRAGYLEAFQSMFPAPRQRSNDMLASGEAALSSLACETLLIHGREDNFVPFDISVRAARVIPRVQLAIFGQCGHWVQIEKHREFNSLLSTFLTSGS
jgi:2-hydroxy-6-oxo-octa-2,4-dienoate hydrolase